jgi:ferredoxin
MKLVEALQLQGLLLRGGFAPVASDAVPLLPVGSAPRWLALIGVAGSAFWPHFTASSQYADGAPNPLDRWSRAIGDALAAQTSGLALYPFGGPPHQPFQRWAERAEGLHASPLGLRLHPQHGLWHSYRFALALPQPLDAPALLDNTDVCARCSGQPCLNACPVNAFTGTEYRVNDCAAHLAATPEPRCADIGCLARHACPVGQQHAQQPEHARFLMNAFRAAR